MLYLLFEVQSMVWGGMGTVSDEEKKSATPGLDPLNASLWDGMGDGLGMMAWV